LHQKCSADVLNLQRLSLTFGTDRTDTVRL